MKWNKKQIKAMEGSISKWEGVVGGESEGGIHDCPCCQAFIIDANGNCYGCPVSVTTGAETCHETPYQAWAKFEENWDEEDIGYSEEREDKATDMLNFLEELLASMKKDNEKYVCLDCKRKITEEENAFGNLCVMPMCHECYEKEMKRNVCEKKDNEKEKS